MTDKELENEIEKKKRQINDYSKLMDWLIKDPIEREKRLDALLEDLNKLVKQRK